MSFLSNNRSKFAVLYVYLQTTSLETVDLVCLFFAGGTAGDIV